MTKSSWSTIGLITIFWILMAAVSSFQTYYFFSQMPSSPPASQAILLASIFSLLWALATPIVLVLARWFPIERQTIWTNLPLHLLFSVVVGILHRATWLGVQFALPSIRSGVKHLTMQRALGDVITSLDYQAMVYWVLLAIHQGALYYRKYQEGKLQESKLQTRLLEAQLAGLRMQLQPHFLFNTLHTINSLMYENKVRASEMIVRLSEFLRVSLENTGEQQIPLERELDFIERYLEIERARFEERLNIEYRIDGAALRYLVPNLLLQPLVENAIKHGISRLCGGGTLRISAFLRNGNLFIFVANSGSFLSSVPLRGGDSESRPARQGIGLANTKARLSALYGDRQSFELRNWPEGGVEAAVVIPALLAPEDDGSGWPRDQGVTSPHESAYSG